MQIKSYLFGVNFVNMHDGTTAHDALYSALSKTKGDWYQPVKTSGKRTLSYRHVADKLICRSVLRPEGIAFKEHVINVDEGDQIKISVRLPLSKRLQTETQTKKVPLPAHEINDHMTAIFERKGMECLDIKYNRLPSNTIVFHKNKRNIVVQCADFTMNVLVKDIEAFREAYLHGIGRYKTYGCGMIVVVG